MRNNLLSTSALVALLGGMTSVATPALAGSLQHQYLNIPSSGNSAFNLSLDLFDNSADTLTSVVVSESLTASAALGSSTSWLAAPTSSSSTTGIDVSATTQLSITGGPAALDGAPLLTLTADLPGQAITGNAIGLTLPYAASTTSLGPSTYAATGDWQAPGGGTDTLSITPVNTTGLGPDYSSTFTTPPLSMDLTVTYFFTANSTPTSTSTPEPATMVTLGAALIGLGVARRRRKLQQQLPPIG